MANEQVTKEDIPADEASTSERTKPVYSCPHCGATFEVTQGLVEETITCPNPDCRRLMQVDPPVAKPAPPGSGATPEYQAVQAPADTERKVMELHPVLFRRHMLGSSLAVVATVAGAAGVIAALVAGGALGLSALGLAVLGVPLLVVGLGLLGYWWLEQRFTTLTVTSERSILREGIISRDTSEVRHDDVRNLQIDQNIWQRMLGIGDIAVSSAGQDNLEIIARGIPGPERVAEVVRERQ